MAVWGADFNSGGRQASAAPEAASGPQSDNTSPLGLSIPQLVGTGGVNGRYIIDIDLVGGVRLENDRYKANLVLGFLDDQLGGTASLLWLKADDEYVFRDEDPKRALGSPMRFYGGDQSALDPLIESHIGADEATYWPGLVYIVLEDYDVTEPNGNGFRLPQFVAGLATSVTTQSASESDTSVTFGSFAADYNNSGLWGYDALTNRGYLTVLDQTNETYFLVTVDLSGKTEIRRAPFSGEFDYNNFLVPLPGSDYVVAQAHDGDGNNYYGLRMIDTRTGSIVASLSAVFGDVTGSIYEPGVWLAQRVRSDTATVYFVIGETWFGGYASQNQGQLLVAVANVTDDTLEWIVHPEIAPGYSVDGVDFVNGAVVESVTNGVATIDITSDDGTTYAIRQLEVSESGVISHRVVWSTGTSADRPTGVAYDSTDDTIVFADASGIIKKINQSGTVQYTNDTGLGSSLYSTPNEFSPLDTQTRLGFAVFYEQSPDKYYLCDLSDGSVTLILDHANNDLAYNQYRGEYYYSTYISSGSTSDFGKITVGALGSTTATVVDATDIIDALATYQGIYASGDLQFDNFPGSECYGYLVAQDTTIDQCIQDIRAVLGIRERHDAGKWIFHYPLRDGSFAVDRTLGDDDIVDRGGTSIVQSLLDEDAELEEVRVEYFDYDVGLIRSEQHYTRPTGLYDVTKSFRRESLSTNLTLTSTQAAKACQRIAYESAYGRKVYNVPVMPSQLDVDPTSAIQYNFGPNDEITVVGEVRSATLRADWTQDLDVTEYMQGQSTTFIGSDLNTPTLTNLNTATDYYHLDTALISYGDDLGQSGLRAYGLIAGVGSTDIETSILYRSDNGFDYEIAGVRGDIAPITGTVSAFSGKLDDGFQTDFENTITVNVASGDASTLASVTAAQRYENGNLAAIGAPGRWVLVSFEDVSVSGNVATLSNIIWGAHGTEAYLDQITAGDEFVLLVRGQFVPIINGTDLLNDPVYYKAGSFVYLVSQLTTETHTADGEAEKPYAVTELASSDVGSTRTITWEYRDRLDPNKVLTGQKSAGYSEDSLSFEIDLIGGSPSEVLTTLTATTNSTSYDTGTYAADSANVYQMSGLGMRGHVATLTF